MEDVYNKRCLFLSYTWTLERILPHKVSPSGKNNNNNNNIRESIVLTSCPRVVLKFNGIWSSPMLPANQSIIY